MFPHIPLSSPRPDARRGGAVIIVVLSLLTLMIFLGVFFFEFVQEEQQASGAFAANPYQVLEPEPYFAEADKQLIIGPDPSRKMSVFAAGLPSEDFDGDNNLDIGEDADGDGVLDLGDTAFTKTPPVPSMNYGTAGTPYSLLAHVIGRVRITRDGLIPSDVIPHNGHGITVTYQDNDSDTFFGPGDYARFDMDGDGTIDAALDPTDATALGVPVFAVNYSRPAQINPFRDAFTQPILANALTPFQPDVEYTYPDINNLFLAHETIDPVTGFRILVPSFHRPDLFPSRRASNFSDLYTNTNTRNLVMRPHSGHRYPDNTPRFLTTLGGTPAQSGDTSRIIPPFPFQEDSDGDGNYNEMGIYSNVTTEVGYDLDVDVNGDGTPDGIWIDLGMNLVDLPDGRQFVPLVSYYILDADSLLNINAHGNLQGAIVNGSAYDSGLPFSVSNTGASASEVNPLRALTGDPGNFAIGSTARKNAFAEQVFSYPSLDPNFPITPLTAANIDLGFILGGRVQSRSGSRLTGRYGESNLISTTSVPGPGVTGADDDLDNSPTSPRYRGGAQRSTTLYDPRGGTASVAVPYASHPVAPHGTGSNAVISVAGPNVGQKTVATVASINSPVVWPTYPGGWEAPNPYPLASGAIPTTSAPYPYGGSDLLGSTIFPVGTTGMTDEDDETRLSNPDRINDDIYRPEENMALQLSGADRQRLGIDSRIDKIAPFSFKFSRESADIRRRFTTDSWDLSELSYVPGRFSAGFSETSVWTGSRRFFPPAFGGTLFAGNDPIRPEVRVLLASENTDYVNPIGSKRREVNTFSYISGNSGTGTAALWRQPLNLNKLLVGYDASGYPIYRDLMPHPDVVAMERANGGDNLTLTIPPVIHDHTAAIPPTANLSMVVSSPTTDAERQQTAVALEWWARYDRQRMARDIYTLLYLVGAPNGTNPATTSSSTVYPTPERVREMAQFAVNMVDALDRDDVITKFEYDNDLSDGWNWSTGGPVVYGIERASLSFSEVAYFQTKEGSELASTLHKEETNVIHQYLHMELRNSSPSTVDLAEGWRISRVVTGTGTQQHKVEFRSNASISSGDVMRVGPGENFLIGTHDGTVVNALGQSLTSDFYVDHNGGSQLELVLPKGPATLADNNSLPANAYTDLDLAAPIASYNDANYFLGTAIDPLYLKLVRKIDDSLGPLIPDTATFDLVLERRQNLRGVGADNMGDWIEVDRFQVNPTKFVSPGAPASPAMFNAGTGSQANVQTAINNLTSLERRQPFDPLQVKNIEATAAQTPVDFNHSMSLTQKHFANLTANALTVNGVIVGTKFSLWQPHFDRDFTSPYELLSVPLYGNWPLTELVSGLHTGTTASTPAGTLTPNTFYREIHGGTQFNLAPGSTHNAATPTSGTAGKLTGDFTAGVRFNFPNGVSAVPYGGWNRYQYQNCWYRFLDFVTVPRRADQQSEEILSGPGHVAGSTKPVFRVPGKINLNTLRDETILAALLDDETHLTYGNLTTDNITALRNWYQELLLSRDGFDYFANAAGYPDVAIPNSISSRPFRSTSRVDPNLTGTTDNSVENGLLRSAESVDRGLAKQRGPFAASGSPPVPPVDLTISGFGAGQNPFNTGWQGLFDAGDLANTGIDYHTRNRILAKIANNSTNKSHVFFVWSAVGYFEAHQINVAGVNRVQIGGRLTDIPIHRRFAVVDMSRLDEAYDTNRNTFDEKKFVIFQKRLR